jgi:hypothetical protein
VSRVELSAGTIVNADGGHRTSDARLEPGHGVARSIDVLEDAAHAGRKHRVIERTELGKGKVTQVR